MYQWISKNSFIKNLIVYNNWKKTVWLLLKLIFTRATYASFTWLYYDLLTNVCYSFMLNFRVMRNWPTICKIKNGSHVNYCTQISQCFIFHILRNADIYCKQANWARVDRCARSQWIKPNCCVLEKCHPIEKLDWIWKFHGSHEPWNFYKNPEFFNDKTFFESFHTYFWRAMESLWFMWTVELPWYVRVAPLHDIF